VDTARAPARDAVARRPASAALQIVNPPEGATYLRDPTLRAEYQTLPLRASGPAPGRLSWRVNGEAVGTAAADAPLDWPLVAGAHTVSVRDARGREASARILVK
jgi:membrane carboxypeptidase/penicillin-binding protein PbpC